MHNNLTSISSVKLRLQQLNIKQTTSREIHFVTNCISCSSKIPNCSPRWTPMSRSGHNYAPFQLYICEGGVACISAKTPVPDSYSRVRAVFPPGWRLCERLQSTCTLLYGLHAYFTIRGAICVVKILVGGETKCLVGRHEGKSHAKSQRLSSYQCEFVSAYEMLVLWTVHADCFLAWFAVALYQVAILVDLSW